MKGTHKELMAKKGAILDELREKFEKTSIIVFTDYRGKKSGLTVKEITDLRRKLREVDAEYKISKNTLISKVLKERGTEGFESVLEDPTAIVLAYGDPIAATKILVDFSKEHKNNFNPDGMPALKAASFEGEVYDSKGVKHLATLPSRNEVLAKLLSLINTPAQKVMGIMKAPGRDFVNIMDQYSKKA